MKKQILLIAILLCTAFAQAQEVFVTADFVSSYIWRGMDSGNASVQPSLGLNWKGLTVYTWGWLLAFRIWAERSWTLF